MKPTVEHYIRTTLPKTVRECREADGTLIALPHPYTVPCAADMFNELYYWDTYFTNVGLLRLGQVALAKNNVDNMLYLVDTYGFMPNGNRTYYLNRSQPPFLSAMVRDVFNITCDAAWLQRAYGTLGREYAFWMTRRVVGDGLNGYTGYEVCDADVDFIYEHYVSRTGQRMESPSAEEKRRVYLATFSFFESGWDCNSRFLDQGHRMMAVDLNSLLYGMERDMAAFAATLRNGEESMWLTRAEARRERMNRLLWDETRGIFADRHADTGVFSTYASAASLYPLFVGLATPEQAAASAVLLDKLLLPHGVAAGEADPPWRCQWDYPNVWAPLQWIAYRAMKQYGLEAQAAAIADRFVTLVENNFEKTGNFWEKYNGVTGTVAADEYDAPPMMGWTAGVYVAFEQEWRG